MLGILQLDFPVVLYVVNFHYKRSIIVREKGLNFTTLFHNDRTILSANTNKCTVYSV